MVPSKVPPVVICKMSICKFSSGRALLAVFNTYHAQPVSVVLINDVGSVRQEERRHGLGLIFHNRRVCRAIKPGRRCGPSSRMVAYVSSASSGNTGRNAGLMPKHSKNCCTRC